MEKIFAIAASIYLVAGIIFFSIRKKSYSNFKHTISELGEKGSLYEKEVSYGLFLAVGVLLLVVAASSDIDTVRSLSVCIGVGYIVAAFFPCDPGSPWSGSSRQQVHNLGGFVEYAGGLYFLNRANTEDIKLFMDINIISGIMLICIVLISIPGFFLRGVAQRIAEAMLLGSVCWMVW
jgi:hypothetical protein